MSTEAPADLLSHRYGSPRRTRGRRFWTALAALAILLAGAFAAWIAVSDSAAPTFKDVSFEVVSTAGATADFDLTKRPEDVVTCAVQALNENFAVVGWTELTVPAAPQQRGDTTTSHRVALRTTNLATTAVVDSCWVEDRARDVT